MEEYAARDEQGQHRLTSAGTFVFQRPGKGAPYEAARELCETEIEIDHKLICVAAPAEDRYSLVSRRWSGL